MHTSRRPAVTDVDQQFVSRWSPRAFAPTPVSEQTLHTLFEAARWAPSCFNEQPWLFVYAIGDDALARYRNVLNEANRVWATAAPVLAIVFARRHFSADGKPNRLAAFDSGAAWMSLALQANKCGLVTHAMAGFNADKAYAAAGVDPQACDVMCVVAIGYQGDAALLPDAVRAKEQPNDRRPLAQIAWRSRFGGDE